MGDCFLLGCCYSVRSVSNSPFCYVVQMQLNVLATRVGNMCPLALTLRIPGAAPCARQKEVDSWWFRPAGVLFSSRTWQGC